MKHRSLLIVVFCSLLLSASRAGASIESEVAAVQQERGMHRATMGVQVMRLGTSPADLQEVFNHGAHNPLTPASNLKLVTTAAALERLGADFKFRTTLYRRGEDLVLIGDGDPTFGDSDYLKTFGWKSTAVYDGWIVQLQKLGVTSVRDVIVDDSVFDEKFIHPDWPEDQLLNSYEAEVAGMNFNANMTEVRTTGGGEPIVNPPSRVLQFKQSNIPGNSVSISRRKGTNLVTIRGDLSTRTSAKFTVHDPSMNAASVLAQLLAANRIKVTGEVKRDRTIRAANPDSQVTAGKMSVVGTHETPLSAVISRANKHSINLYAESLCKRIGYDPATGAPGSWETGGLATAAYLKSAGIPESDFSLADGCGLSKKNAISARALVRVLCYEFYGKNRDLFVQSLSVAGVKKEGTLEDRFEGSDLRRRVFGKSGYVNGVSTLTGFLQARDGQWYAFSVMFNGMSCSNHEAHLMQERIVKAVDAEVSKK